MGQAKLRGSKEQRIEQSLARQKQEAIEREAARKEREEQRRQAEAARIAALPQQEQAMARLSRPAQNRRSVMGTASGRSMLMAGVLIAAGAGAALAAARPLERSIDLGPDPQSDPTRQRKPQRRFT